MPARERDRIHALIQGEAWAARAHARLREQAAADWYAAALLCALDRDTTFLPVARDFLLDYGRKGGDLGPKRRDQLQDPGFFRAGQPWLGDVYYKLDIRPLVAYAWIRPYLDTEERHAIEQGILASARFRMRAMDRWHHTPNLMFKPTFMVAFAALVTGDEELTRWGFYRQPGSPRGGYYSVLQSMLGPEGPWREAPLYPIAHKTLWCMAAMSRYCALADPAGADWFSRAMPGTGGSPRGLLRYYLDSAYPAEQAPDGTRRIRVASYGDGSTGPSGHDIFLVNAPGAKGVDCLPALTAAMAASPDPAVAYFLGLSPDYRPDLWDHPPLPPAPAPPAAPSRIWPDYGLAMLRSDESPAYWTSPTALAAFMVMSQGYGHDHRDKFSITLFGAGRLLYPDYNALQYENPALGWTRNSVSHNLVVVDGQDTANARPTAIRHDFRPGVKFLAVSADQVFQGVRQTRALFLASSYLLDIFHLDSALPHTYDYLIHAFGRARPLEEERFAPDPALGRRMWAVEDWRAMRASGPWALDFVHEDGAGVRVRMAGVPDTLAACGRWGGRLAALVRERKGTLDRLATLAARREGVARTTFVAVHEPFAHGRGPGIREVELLAETDEALLVRVRGKGFTDLAALSLGDPDRKHCLGGDGTALCFQDHVYLRTDGQGRAEVAGRCLGLRLPGAVSLAGDGRDLPVAVEDGVLVFGGQVALQPRKLAREQAPDLEVGMEPEMARGFAGETVPLRFVLRNTLEEPVSGHIAAELPPDMVLEPARPEFGPLEPGREEVVEAALRLGQTQGIGRFPFRLYLDAGPGRERPGPAHVLACAVGASLEAVYRYPERPVYRVYSPGFTLDMDMENGLFRRLLDPDGTPRLDGGPLFTISDGKAPVLDDQGHGRGYTWPHGAPASLLAEAGPPERRCRWRALFRGARARIAMDPDWTRFARARFTLPGNWVSPDGPARWSALVSQGRLVADPGQGRHGAVEALELAFPGAAWNLALAFHPPLEVELRGEGLRFSLDSQGGGGWEMGFIRPGGLEEWAAAGRAGGP